MRALLLLFSRGSIVLFAAACIALAGCSDETQKSTSGDPGPDGTEPTGAVNMEVYANDTQTCPPGNVHIDVGTVNSSPPIFAIDGFDGASVTCSVKPGTGKNFDVSGALEKGKFSFAFNVTTDGSSAIGKVEFSDPAAGTRYSSGAAMPCVFQFAPGTAQGVEAGEIFVQFDCASLVSAAEPKDECSSRYGYVRLFNCAK